MGDQAPLHGPWLYLVPLISVAIILLRNARTRRLRIEFLWIAPALFLLITGALLANEPPPGPIVLAAEILALIAGGVAGWWRGRLTRIAVDPQTHQLTTRTSPIGMVLILALFAIRYGLRASGVLPQTPGLATTGAAEVLMLLAVGLICAQRLEIWLRATRLLKEARGA